MAPRASKRERINKFVEVYLSTFNASEAARQSGYTGKRANIAGTYWMRNPKVKERIQEAMKTLEMGPEEAVARLSRIARFNLGMYLLPDGTVDIPKLLASEDACLVKKVTPRRIGLEVEFHDPLVALDKIGRYHKLFTDRVEVDSESALTITGVDYRSAITPLSPQGDVDDSTSGIKAGSVGDSEPSGEA